MDLTQFSPSSALLTVIVLALAPFVAVMVTSFTKIVVVLSLLRNALGVQQIPPNVVLNGIALILTVYVMYPVGRAHVRAEVGEVEDHRDVDREPAARGADRGQGAASGVPARALERARARVLPAHRRTHERARPTTSGTGATDFIVIVPAFTISELTSAFQIGFLIFLPFIVIDLVIANILMAMGMMMLSPTVVSLPFKLLLFVLIEGWAKLAHGLVLSYL